MMAGTPSRSVIMVGEETEVPQQTPFGPPVVPFDLPVMEVEPRSGKNHHYTIPEEDLDQEEQEEEDEVDGQIRDEKKAERKARKDLREGRIPPQIACADGWNFFIVIDVDGYRCYGL